MFCRVKPKVPPCPSMYSSELLMQHRFGSDGLHLGVGHPSGGLNRTTDVGKASSCKSSLFEEQNNVSVSTCESLSAVNSSDMSNNYLSNWIVVGSNYSFSSNKMVVGLNDNCLSIKMRVGN